MNPQHERAANCPLLALVLVLAAGLVVVPASNAIADIPRMISYQGVITDSTGDVITIDNATVHFRIYHDEHAPLPIWTESEPKSILDGMLIHKIGSVAPLPDTLFTRFDQLWLEIEVTDGGGINHISDPRIQLVASGYAFRVSTVDSASGGDITGEVTISSSSDKPTLSVTNSGSGGGGRFLISGSENSNAAVYGSSEGSEDLACAIYGVLSSSSTGWGSAAVKGENLGGESGGASGGAGVYGFHKGSGFGVYGRAEGESGWGVWGYSEYGIGVHGTSINDISGYFSGGRVQIIGGTDASISDNTSGRLILGTTNTENLVLDGNEIIARDNGAASTLHLQAEGGTVAVGLQGVTPPSGYILAVDGKAVFEEVEVQLSQDWPDYVFMDDYGLMPLDELEREIADKGHLPDLPSAAEAEGAGIALGEMQTKLLIKIEELTLHLIEMDKRLKGLESENAQLKRELCERELVQAGNANLAGE